MYAFWYIISIVVGATLSVLAISRAARLARYDSYDIASLLFAITYMVLALVVLKVFFAL